MKIKDFIYRIDPDLPIWINHIAEETADFFINIEEATKQFGSDEVIYITLDGTGTLTIEV